MVLKSILRKHSVQASFMSSKGKWEGQEVIGDSRHLGTSTSSRKMVKLLCS